MLLDNQLGIDSLDLVDKSTNINGISEFVCLGTILGYQTEHGLVRSNYVVYIGSSLPEKDLGVVDLFVPSSSFSYFSGTILNFNGHLFNVSSYLPLSSNLYKSLTLSHFFYELYNTFYISYSSNSLVNVFPNIINSSVSNYNTGFNRVLPLVL